MKLFDLGNEGVKEGGGGGVWGVGGRLKLP